MWSNRRRNSKREYLVYFKRMRIYYLWINPMKSYYSSKKASREKIVRIKRISKIFKKRANLVPAQQDAIEVLEREWIQYVREKPIITNNSFYLIDLYLPEYNMCIEIDGSTHNLPSHIEKDRIRDEWLKSNWYWVFRIKIETVKKTFWRKLKFAIRVRNYYMR